MRSALFKGNVFVTNLPEDFTAGDLAGLFDEFGLVLGAKVLPPASAERSPAGLVAVAPATAAEKAILALDGYVVGERKLKVQKAKEEPDRPRPAKPAAPASAVSRAASAPSRPQPAPAAAPSRPLIVERRPLRRVQR